MTEPFDWAGLIERLAEKVQVATSAEESEALLLAALQREIEAAFVPVETYHRDTGIRDAVAAEATARAEAAEARVKVLEGALELVDALMEPDNNFGAREAIADVLGSEHAQEID